MHSITSRPSTDEERTLMERLSSYTWRLSFMIVLTLAVGVGVWFGLGGLGSWLGSLVAGEDGAAVGEFIGRAIAVIVGLIVSVGVSLSLRPLILRMREDAASGEVQEVHVRCERVVQFRDAHILWFDLGDDWILALHGDWLVERSIYGVAHGEARDRVTVNRLSGNFAFPSTEFIVTRVPRSGWVFRIQVLGTYLKPVKTTIEYKMLGMLCRSELYRGRLEAAGRFVADREL